MRRAIILFWHGLTGILTGIANWITVVLGMKDNSKYGKLLRRIVGTCFTLFVILCTVAATCSFFETLCNRYDITFADTPKEVYTQYLSRNATFCRDSYYEKGYVIDRNDNKTLKNIQWIAKPLGDDSLICYSDGKQRGYFNMFTGKVAIKPRYDHAWIFSDGLASVDDNGWIKFIDPTGKVIIDNHQPYIPGMEGYVFHNGFCVVHNERRDKVGLIDLTGKWILEPQYFSIQQYGTLLIVNNGIEETVMDTKLNTIIPYAKASYWIYDGIIFSTMQDHTMRQYDLQGNLIDDFYISHVEKITYPTNELRYGTTKNYDDNGKIISETEDNEPTNMQAIARCMCYQAEQGWYGLMSPDGRIITPPSYSTITAVGADLYLCESQNDYGVLLNGKGERVK
nr:WG repeat-containing protein [Bacteroides intestinalis]